MMPLAMTTSHGNDPMSTAAIDTAIIPARIERRVHVAVDHPAFAGHFPGQPILPGVALVAEVLEAIRSETALHARVGDAPRLAVVKFNAPVLPGASLVIALMQGRTGIDFEVREGDRLAASGRVAFADRGVPA